MVAFNNLTNDYYYIFDVENITFTLPISVRITRTNDDGDDIVIGSNVIVSFDANERFDFETKSLFSDLGANERGMHLS